MVAPYSFDEIGTLSLSAQGKLLRALQEKEFERVGDEQTRKVNTRVVAATNQNLLDEVKAGTFREESLFPPECISSEYTPASRAASGYSIID